MIGGALLHGGIMNGTLVHGRMEDEGGRMKDEEARGRMKDEVHGSWRMRKPGEG